MCVGRCAVAAGQLFYRMYGRKKSTVIYKVGENRWV